MSKTHKNICTTFNFAQHLLTLISAITWCVSISVFPNLVGTPIGFASSEVGLKIGTMAPGIKKY